METEDQHIKTGLTIITLICTFFSTLASLAYSLNWFHPTGRGYFMMVMAIFNWCILSPLARGVRDSPRKAEWFMLFVTVTSDMYFDIIQGSALAYMGKSFDKKDIYIVIGTFLGASNSWIRFIKYSIKCMCGQCCGDQVSDIWSLIAVVISQIINWHAISKIYGTDKTTVVTTHIASVVIISMSIGTICAISCKEDYNDYRPR
eukprot:230910_1